MHQVERSPPGPLRKLTRLSRLEAPEGFVWPAPQGAPTLPGMADDLDQLLDATIQHLQDLKSRGRRFVNVSGETLAALRGLPPTPARRTAPPPDRPPAPAVQSSALTRPPPPAASAASPQAHRIPAEARPSGKIAAEEPPAETRLTDSSKVQAIQALRAQALACRKCPHLVASRRNVVFGVGSITADLMFVGEAPGMDEDAQGEPFVGRAGQLLTKIIKAMGLEREQVYIGNILKCRPDTPGQPFGNRAPTEEEMETCLPWLLGQIDLIQPKVLVALGGTAVKGLLGVASGITRLRGQWQSFRGVPVMPTFHPSYLLRPENAPKKRLVWEDMLQVMAKLDLPISEKQRGYFLKP